MKAADQEFKENMGAFFFKGLIFLFLIVFIRFLEFGITSDSDSAISWFFAGLWQDVIAGSSWMVFILPIYIYGIRYFKNLTNFILSIWLSIGFFFQLLFVIYFSLSQTALRIEHLNGMSASQADFLMELYGFSWFYMLAIIPLTIAVHYVLKLSNKLKGKRVLEICSALLIIFGSLLNIFWPIQESEYNSDIDFEAISNKTQIFLRSYFSSE